jgi:acetyl-CoA acetyltransferase
MNHLHGSKNEYAQYQRKITVESVLNARKEARKPLGLLDFAPISDGAAVLILTSDRIAAKSSCQPVYVLGSASATDYLTYPAREDMTHFVATRIAIANALKTAGIGLTDLQLIELYDQSTVMEMVSLEDLGFCKPGTAWKSIYENSKNSLDYLELDGRRLHINVNGGLKADGNPLGATGGAEIYEIFKQLQGEAGERQVKEDKELKYGCVLELEGFGTKGYTYILGTD